MYIHLKDIIEIWLAPQLTMAVIHFAFAALERDDISFVHNLSL